MTFESRITRCPLPFDRDRASEATLLFSDLSPRSAELISGTSGCSPYLGHLIRSEADWLPAALDQPEKALADLMEQVHALTLDQLPDRTEVFDFIAGYAVRPVRAEDPVNIQAAELMGRLHDDLGVLRVARAFERLRPPLRPWPTPPR